VIKVQFYVDKYQLAYLAIVDAYKSDVRLRKWENLRSRLEAQFSSYPVASLFLSKDVSSALSFIGYGSDLVFPNILIDPDTTDKIFNLIFESEEFRVLLDETREYKKWINSLWHENATVINQFFCRFGAGPDVPQDIGVAVMHPGLGIGCYLGRGTVEWGMESHRVAYQLAGLSHEILHAVAEPWAQRLSEWEKWLLHAIIYLCADFELQKWLGGSCEAFSIELVEGYDGRLIAVAKQIYARWFGAIACRSDSIRQVYGRVRNNTNEFEIGRLITAAAMEAPD
jgi:hypothetical protein